MRLFRSSRRNSPPSELDVIRRLERMNPQTYFRATYGIVSLGRRLCRDLFTETQRDVVDEVLSSLLSVASDYSGRGSIRKRESCCVP